MKTKEIEAQVEVHPHQGNPPIKADAVLSRPWQFNEQGAPLCQLAIRTLDGSISHQSGYHRVPWLGQHRYSHRQLGEHRESGQSHDHSDRCIHHLLHGARSGRLCLRSGHRVGHIRRRGLLSQVSTVTWGLQKSKTLSSTRKICLGVIKGPSLG